MECFFCNRPGYNRIRKGTAKPSFKPLSISNPLRIFEGNFLFSKTVFPKAASVGANNVPIIAASHMLSLLSRIAANIIPEKMVSGIPILSNRKGIVCWWMVYDNPIRDASLNRTNTNANSAIKRIRLNWFPRLICVEKTKPEIIPAITRNI